MCKRIPTWWQKASFVVLVPRNTVRRCCHCCKQCLFNTEVVHWPVNWPVNSHPGFLKTRHHPTSRIWHTIVHGFEMHHRQFQITWSQTRKSLFTAKQNMEQDDISLSLSCTCTDNYMDQKDNTTSSSSDRCSSLLPDHSLFPIRIVHS